MPCFNCCCECFILVCGVSELSHKLGSDVGRLGSLVLGRLSKLRSSVESWNADSILSWSENFERWWRKSVIAIDYRSYRKFLFNFLDWSRVHQVSSSRENCHYLLI